MAKNYLSNKDIQILTGVGIPSEDGATGATGSIYSNTSDGSLWSQTTGSTSGWVQLAGGNSSGIYGGSGTLSGDRIIDTDGNGIVIAGSVEGVYLDMHAFKGSGGWSIGTTFNSLTVDWDGGGTNAAFGQIYATEGFNLKVGEVGNPCTISGFDVGGQYWSPMGPTQSSSIGDLSASEFAIRTEAGMTQGIDDSMYVKLNSNGSGIIIDGWSRAIPSFLETGNGLTRGNQTQYNSTQGGAGYTSGIWGPNVDGVVNKILYAETTPSLAVNKATLFGVGGIPINDMAGIPVYVATGLPNRYSYGQVEATVNCITAAGNITCIKFGGAFKTVNGTATMSGQYYDTVIDENSGGLTISLGMGAISSFLSNIEFTCTSNIAGEEQPRVVWNIDVKVHASTHDISAVF